MRPISLALAMLAALAFAPVPASARPPATKSFIKDAIQADIAELGLAKLMRQKSQNPNLRAYAKTLGTDYVEAKAKAVDVAHKVGVEPPTKPQPAMTDEDAKLAKLSGAAFDRACIQRLIRDHRQSIVAFTLEARTSDNPAVTDMARSTLPILKKHLQLAMLLQQVTG